MLVPSRSEPHDWWELTCRSCGEVGYVRPPAPEWTALFRAHLRGRCPECCKGHPRQRRLRVVPESAVPAWILAWAAEDAEFGPVEVEL
jgi:hypothetical protein